MITELLSGRIGTFIGDNTVQSVSVQSIENILEIGGSRSFRKWFQPIDNLLLESVCLSLPACFSTAFDVDNQNVVSLLFKDDVGTYYQMTEIHELGVPNGYFNIPVENTIIPINAKLSFPREEILSPLATGCGLYARGYDILISMLGAPDEVNGVEYPVLLSATIKHTLPMVAI